MPFLVQGSIDDHTLAVTTATAQEAFAKAIEWHVVERITDVSIYDGTKVYSIDAFHWQWRSWRLRGPSRPTPC
jgi:hypothetical protein